MARPGAAPARLRKLFDPSALRITTHGATPDFDGVPTMAWMWPAWVGVTYNLTAEHSLSEAGLREALRSYMASIAFTDEQVARILAAVKSVGYAPNTLVTLTSDHGQNLGEHNTWTKMTNWEHSLRVPLIISAPWLGPASAGGVHGGMAELVDLYRTLADLAGAPPVEAGVDGASLAAAVRDPTSAGKPYAFSQIQRISIASLKKEKPWNTPLQLPAAADAFYDPSCFSDREQIEWMGYSVRSATYRYTEWYRWNGSALRPVADDAAPSELYDHRNDTSLWDPDASEYDNVAGDAAHAAAEAALRSVLRAQVFGA